MRMPLTITCTGREQVDWLNEIPREAQFATAVVIGEHYKGAQRAHARQKHLNNIEQRILPSVTALPYDVATAKVFKSLENTDFTHFIEESA